MNIADIHAYWIPAIKSLYGTEDTTNAHRLDRALGVLEYQTYVRSEHAKDVPIDPELVPVLRALAGPYAKAVLKAYRIRKGLE